MKFLFKLGCILLFLPFLPFISFASPLKPDNNFLILSDIHLDKQSTHQMEISPTRGIQDNDLDWATFQLLLAATHRSIQAGIITKPQFIIVLGDLVGHMRSTSTSAEESETLVFNAVKNTFPDTPLFYVFGNNDSLTVNYGPFSDSASPNVSKSPYDVAINEGHWKNGFLSTGVQCGNQKNIFPCLMTQNTVNGYYSAYLKPQLRLITLNSVLFSPRRTQVSEKDAMSQLDWLEQQLKTAETNKESVLIAMHIPPGNNVFDHSAFWLPAEQDAFLKLLNSYQNIILGILSSHTHAEELKIIKDGSNKTISGVYFTAALSTSHGNAPSEKTFYIEKKEGKWLLSNYETFYMKDILSNLIFNKLYDYQNYYCEKDHEGLSACLDNITPEKMKKYFSAGNPNFDGTMNSPGDFILIQKND